MKIANIDKERIHMFWTTWAISIKLSGETWLMLLSKVTRKLGLHPLFGRYIFQISTGESNWPIAFLGLKLLQKKQFRKQQKQLVTWLVIKVSIKLQRIYNRIIQQLIHKQKNGKQLKHENIYAYLQKKIASYWWYKNNVII